MEAHIVGCGELPGRGRRRWSTRRGSRPTGSRSSTRSTRPRPGFVEGLLTRLGVPPHVARLLGVTPSLTLSWLGAVAIALAVAVAGAYQGERGLALFLCVAALAPVAGVAATFARGIDPTHELGLAAPMSSVRLLLLRTRRGGRRDARADRDRRARAARAWPGRPRRGCCPRSG